MENSHFANKHATGKQGQAQWWSYFLYLDPEANKNNASDTSSYSGGDTITYIVDFCGFRFFFRYILQFSPLFHPETPKHSQLQEFLGTLRCFGFVVNVDWALIPWGGEGG